jgi:hypothetical protein
MSSPAIDSALAGIAAHQGWFDEAAGVVSRAGLPDDGATDADALTGVVAPDAVPVPIALAAGSGELVDAIVGTMVAGHGVAANSASLRTALDMERSLIDVLA